MRIPAPALAILLALCGANGAAFAEATPQPDEVRAAVISAGSRSDYALSSGLWRRQRPGHDIEPERLRFDWRAPRTVGFHTLGRSRFNDEVAKAAQRAGIDPALVHAVIRVESGYNAGAVSPKGAMGLMQVIPSTGRRFGVDDLLDPSANLRAGTQYLSHLMQMFGGDLRLVLAAYNAGENAVIRYGNSVPPYRETAGYVPRVLGIYRALQSQPAPVPVSSPSAAARPAPAAPPARAE